MTPLKISDNAEKRLFSTQLLPLTLLSLLFKMMEIISRDALSICYDHSPASFVVAMGTTMLSKEKNKASVRVEIGLGR